jgi:hypothetical protein
MTTAQITTTTAPLEDFRTVSCACRRNASVECSGRPGNSAFTAEDGSSGDGRSSKCYPPRRTQIDSQASAGLSLASQMRRVWCASFSSSSCWRREGSRQLPSHDCGNGEPSTTRHRSRLLQNGSHGGTAAHAVAGGAARGAGRAEQGRAVMARRRVFRAPTSGNTPRATAKYGSRQGPV